MAEKTTKKTGRPRFKPTDEQRYSVELMAAIGIQHEAIASAIGISQTTLREYFRTELDSGKTKVVAKVADSLVRQALSGNVTAAIFFLKTQGRWREDGTPKGAPEQVRPVQPAAPGEPKRESWDTLLDGAPAAPTVQ